MACSRPMPAVSSSGGRRPPVLLDRLDGLANAVDGVADGVRKVAIEQKEFEDAVGCEIGCVDLAVGLEGRATAQQTRPAQDTDSRSARVPADVESTG